jgi:hypothetical protein
VILTRIVAAAAIVLGFSIDCARAQSADRPGRFEIAAGPRWTGGVSLPAGEAHETTSSGTAFRLFTASTTLASATSFDARFGVRITRRLEAQVSGSYGEPTLRISVSDDVENAAPITSTERMQQFTVRGGASWTLPRFGRPGLAPFLAAGAGYLRELHAARALVQTGRVFEIGGGATYPFRSNNSGRFKELGARVDARAVLRSKGALFDDALHTTPALGVVLYVRF